MFWDSSCLPTHHSPWLNIKYMKTFLEFITEAFDGTRSWLKPQMTQARYAAMNAQQKADTAKKAADELDHQNYLKQKKADRAATKKRQKEEQDARQDARNYADELVYQNRKKVVVATIWNRLREKVRLRGLGMGPQAEWLRVPFRLADAEQRQVIEQVLAAYRPTQSDVTPAQLSWDSLKASSALLWLETNRPDPAHESVVLILYPAGEASPDRPLGHPPLKAPLIVVPSRHRPQQLRSWRFNEWTKAIDMITNPSHRRP